MSRTIRGIPLRRCSRCGAPPAPPEIFSPAPGNYLADAQGGAELVLRADAPEVAWPHNGSLIEPAPDGRFRFGIGRHQLSAIAPDGRFSTVGFTVSGRTQQPAPSQAR